MSANLLAMCFNVQNNIMDCVAASKPKGVDLVKEIEAMGFELPLGAVMHLWDGRYESFSVNTEMEVFTLKISGYDELVVHKTKYPAENTPL